MIFRSANPSKLPIHLHLHLHLLLLLLLLLLQRPNLAVRSQREDPSNKRILQEQVEQKHPILLIPVIAETPPPRLIRLRVKMVLMVDLMVRRLLPKAKRNLAMPVLMRSRRLKMMEQQQMTRPMMHPEVRLMGVVRNRLPRLPSL